MSKRSRRGYTYNHHKEIKYRQCYTCWQWKYVRKKQCDNIGYPKNPWYLGGSQQTSSSGGGGGGGNGPNGPKDKGSRSVKKTMLKPDTHIWLIPDNIKYFTDKYRAREIQDKEEGGNSTSSNAKEDATWKEKEWAHWNESWKLKDWKREYPQWNERTHGKEGQKDGETDVLSVKPGEFTTEKLPDAVSEVQNLIHKYSARDLQAAAEILRSNIFQLATPAAIGC